MKVNWHDYSKYIYIYMGSKIKNGNQTTNQIWNDFHWQILFRSKGTFSLRDWGKNKTLYCYLNPNLLSVKKYNTNLPVASFWSKLKKYLDDGVRPFQNKGSLIKWNENNVKNTVQHKSDVVCNRSWSKMYFSLPDVKPFFSIFDSETISCLTFFDN